MGAALTYARRYALFTMVGIAGEDDLDAPDLNNDQPNGDKAVEGGTAPEASTEPPPSQFRTTKPSIPPVRARLGLEESAATGAQLIREIEALPEVELQLRAIAILKAKNRLSPDDAKRVEDAFATKMAHQCDANKASAKDEPKLTPIEATPPEPPSASTNLAKPRRPRGRPRKTIATIQKAAVVAPPPKVDDSVVPDVRTASQVPERDLNATTVIKIDKSMLKFGELRRYRDKTHLRFVALQPCLVCGRVPSDAHHLRFAQPRALGRKTSDEFVVPLCRAHHRQNHQVGDEVAWWRASGIDAVQVANRLWAISRGVGDKPK
jgi:hypothetical protein